jgi:hypothetical protein
MTIHKSIRVEGPAEIAFKLFCEQIGQWWPKGPSFGGKHATGMFIEGRVGGRFYQVYADGTEFEIGRYAERRVSLPRLDTQGARRGQSTLYAGVGAPTRRIRGLMLADRLLRDRCERRTRP